MIDTHCHLDFDVYDGRRAEVIEQAQSDGVHTIINIGVDLESSRQGIELAEQHDGLYATVGVHPHDAKTLNDSVLAELRQLAGQPKVVGIGEIGLDYYRNLSPRDAQVRAFRRQLELAVEMKLPVVIHTRESFKETLQVIREYSGDLCGGVFHCFPGTIEDAHEVIALGFVVSFGGVITFDKARMALVATETPLESIILETDAPYLTPTPYRGKQNQPAYVKYVYQKLAELKEIDLSQIERTVDRTAQKLFRLVEVFGD